jgi:hypothetical protein
MFLQCPKVQAAGIVDPANGIGDGYDFHTVPGERKSGNGADVAEALHGSGGFAQVQPNGVGGAVDEVRDAAAGGFAAA